MSDIFDQVVAQQSAQNTGSQGDIFDQVAAQQSSSVPAGTPGGVLPGVPGAPVPKELVAPQRPSLAGTNPTKDAEGRFGSAPAPTARQRVMQYWRTMTAPKTPDQEVADGYTLPGTATAASIAHNVGGRAMQTAASPLIHPWDTIKSTAETALEASPPGMVYDAITGHQGPIAQRAREFGEEWKQNKPEAVENLAGDALGVYEGARLTGAGAAKAAPIASVPIDATGDILENSGVDQMNSILRAKEGDYDYGRDPGEAVLKEGPGTSIAGTRRGLDANIGAQTEEAGKQVGAVRQAVAQRPIDRAALAQEINPILDNLENQVQGVGGSPGKLSGVQDFRSTFDRLLSGQGNVTAGELYNDIDNLDANINYNRNAEGVDATVNNARRQLRAVLKRNLYDAVPELIEPSERYANLKTAGELAHSRTFDRNGGIFDPWKTAAALTAGFGTEFAAHDPALGYAAAIATRAVPEVAKLPIVRTGMATGLFQAGRGLQAVGRGLRSFGGSADVDAIPNEASYSNQAYGGQNASYGSDKVVHAPQYTPLALPPPTYEIPTGEPSVINETPGGLVPAERFPAQNVGEARVIRNAQGQILPRAQRNVEFPDENGQLPIARGPNGRMLPQTPTRQAYMAGSGRPMEGPTVSGPGVLLRRVVQIPDTDVKVLTAAEGGGKPISDYTMRAFLQKAGGDEARARTMAEKKGWKLPQQRQHETRTFPQTPTPETHDFSVRAWKAANPNGNVGAARAKALGLGYEVVD